MTDGQLDGRTQRCEELSGKGKALSNGVQSDAIDAGPRRVARKRGVTLSEFFSSVYRPTKRLLSLRHVK